MLLEPAAPADVAGQVRGDPVRLEARPPAAGRARPATAPGPARRAPRRRPGRRRRSRPARPTGARRRCRRPRSPRRSTRKRSRNVVASSSQVGSCRASSWAIRSIDRKANATQLVASDCSSRQPAGTSRGPVEHRDVVHPEEAALEQVAAGGVLAVEPPRDMLSSSLLSTAPRNARSRAPSMQVDLPGRPGVHRRVDVGERPLVRGQLAVRGAGPTRGTSAAAGPWRAPGRRARARPRGTPGPRRRTRGTPSRRACEITSASSRCVQAVLRPPAPAPLRAAGRLGRVALEPLAHRVAVDLLAPQQPGERAARDVAVGVGGRSAGITAA